MKRKSFLLLLTIFSICPFVFSSPAMGESQSQQESSDEQTLPESNLIPPETSPGYTINFDNVSIIEYIKFISKISGINFIYDESKLNFNVTIISEEPTSIVNVMSALVQVLRINGYDLIEQGNNLVVTNTGKVQQIGTVVSQEVPIDGKIIPPIMTRVFKVKNANPMNLAGLVRPLLSDHAVVEVSQETRHIIITDITQNIEQIYRLFYSLDIPRTSLEIDCYTTRNNSPETLISLAQQIIIPISEGNPLIFVPQDSTNSIFIVSTPFLVEKSISILTDLDNPPSITKPFTGPITGKNILIYHIKNKSANTLQNALKEIENDLSQQGSRAMTLLTTLESMKYIQGSHAFLFTGNPQSLAEIQLMLTDLDTPISENTLLHSPSHIYTYKIKHASEVHISQSLKQIIQLLNNSPDINRDLIASIESMKWIKQNNSLIFNGDKASIQRLTEILPTLDTPRYLENKAFYSYTPVNENPEELLKQIQEYYKNLKDSDLTDQAFMHTLASAKIVVSTKSIVFTGDDTSIKRLEAFLPMIDQPTHSPSNVYVYKIKYVDPEFIEKSLRQLGKSVPSGDPLAQIIDNMKYVSESNTLIFNGSPKIIEHLKQILPTLDNTESAQEEEKNKTTYFIYPLENASGNEVLKELTQTATSIKPDTSENQELINSIHTIKWIQSPNSLIINATPPVIAQLKQMIAKFDIPRSESSAFYVYKPEGVSPKDFQEQVMNAAKEMKKSGLRDDALIKSMESATLVSDNTAVMFTGTPKGINKLKEIIHTFDSPDIQINKFFVFSPQHISVNSLNDQIRMIASDMKSSKFSNTSLIHTLMTARIISHNKSLLFIGNNESIQEINKLVLTLDTALTIEDKVMQKTIFAVYKILHVSPTVLMNHLKNMANDFQSAGSYKIGSSQYNLIKTLNNMRFIKDNNTIIFTGTSEAVNESIILAKKFDIVELAADSDELHLPTTFLIYNPKNVSGEELIKILHDFEKNLINSGIHNKELFLTINNLKWIERTSSILISGDPDGIKKVQELLEKFDIPTSGQGEADLDIAVDMSFLIYKLQYHSGSDIQNAIKQIGSDLDQIKNSSNSDLVQAIQTIQWIEITNSLIATGKPNSLSKLKELIKSIDIPLKQVFVEVLVIETTIGNQLTFGLRWGSQGVYKDRFSYGTYGTPNTPVGQTDPLGDFNTNLQSITSTNTPKGEFIPIASGFDLGVIGDMILHKGKTYLALGSLVDAIRVEGDTTIVMNQKIITQDNKMSTIFIGKNIPYTGSYVQNEGANTINSTNLEYRDVGVSLSITPTVGNNDIITLEIEQDISEAVTAGDHNHSTSSTSVSGITTSKSSTKTIASVPDKSFLVISGSIQDTTIHNKTSIPCLGGLPLIGAAFSNNLTDKEVANNIIFVRPQIIKSFDTYAEITENQENIHRSQANNEDFDAGVELVRTPDDTY